MAVIKAMLADRAAPTPITPEPVHLHKRAAEE